MVSVLQELEGGSNSWVLAGQRTASGAPLLAGDPIGRSTPQRVLSKSSRLPGLRCRGAVVPRCSGLPHFGHNRAVAWCVTTAMADYQDLYIERFHPGNPQFYEIEGKWRQVQHQREVIRVRNGQPVEIDVSVTHHGPIIIGDPAQGYALALRYARRWPSPMPASMLYSRCCAPLASTSSRRRCAPGSIPATISCSPTCTVRSATERGQVPIRSRANAWLPVPGWTGEYAWRGMIPFEDMPRLRNPEAGFMVTANNRIVDETYPRYLALHYEPGFRARRIARLSPLLTPAG